MTHQLKGLVGHAGQGGQLQNHDDVPEDIRQQLYAEEQHQLERHRKSSKTTVQGIPPITITNVLPTSHHPAPNHLTAPPMMRPEVPGMLDTAVELYSEWQQSRVGDKAQKADIRRVCEVALRNGLDLQQIFEDKDPDLFIKEGVSIGVARRFVRDIEYWVQQQNESEAIISS